MIGKKLAHYEITGAVGKGGMGEVYRATDTRLGREVAIKVLPQEMSGDAERIARFEREARTLATLQHPNIASIYGYEEADGVRFLAMELVEGDDLSQRLDQGGLPLDEALAVMHQVAVGLEAAHERGIIHRDLKPANVKVAPDGTVKILDFGLARALAGEGVDDANLANSPTITAAMTKVGTILGTAAYMSPEQAKGKGADRRSDIWSFGVMAYEMLVGRKLFDGETLSETMAEVLKTPIDLDGLPPATPPAVRQLLERCLDRDPHMRLRDIGEARIVLADPGQAPAAAGAATARGASSSRLPWVVAGAALVALLALGAWVLLRPGPPPPPSLRFSINNDTPATLRQGDGGMLAISPDGQLLVSIANQDDQPMLFLRRLDSFEARALPGTENTNSPSFSPDGQWVLFHGYDGLHKISVAGGVPMKIGNSPASVWGSTWADDGFIYFCSTANVYRIPATGGDYEIVYDGAAAGNLRYPHALPGSRALLVNRFDGVRGLGRLFVLDLASGELRDLNMQGSCPTYLGNGTLLFAQNGQVMAAPFDATALGFTGPPVPVLPRTWIEQDLLHLAAARNGTIAYLPDLSEDRASVQLVDRQGGSQPLLPGGFPFNGCGDPRLSPDGTRLAMAVNSFEIWILDLATETPTLVSESGFYPVWSPDGRYLWYGSTRNRSFDIYRVPTDFSEPERRVLDWENNLRSAEMAPDGSYIFREEVPDKGMDLKLWPAGGDSSSIRGLLEGPDDELAPDVSPDGRWIAYVSGLSGRDEIYVTSFPDPGARIQVSNGGGTSPAWSPDGDEIFYMDGIQVIAAQVSTADGFRVSSREELFEGAFLQYRWHRQYEVHPDGEHFLVVENPPRGEIEVVTHWFPELEQKLEQGR